MAARGRKRTEAAPSAPYTDEKKDWLNGGGGSESSFLTAHGLSIYKDKERGDGRRMARAMMEGDEDGGTNT